MKRFRLVCGLGSLTLALVGGIVVACGGSDATICGAGTTNVGGVCQVVPPDGSTVDVIIGPDGDPQDSETPFVDADVPDAVTPTDASDAAVAPNRCPFGKGPVMAEIPNPGQNNGTFCIDSTEVTEAQYDQFLKSKNGNTGGQILECTSNTYEPNCLNLYTFNPGLNPNLPVRCVDWCDAKAYCDWAGKKLCNQLDKSNGPGTATSRAYWTCTNGNGTTHPQGTLSDNTCWQPGGLDGGPVNVASVGCKGKFSPYDSTNDVLGNVAEWQSYCDPDSGLVPGVHLCSVFGTGFIDTSNGQGCAAPAASKTSMRTYRGLWLGVRCCAD